MQPRTPDIVLAEFADAAPVVTAIGRLRALGICGIDVFTPYPVRDIEDALSISRSRIPFFAFGMAMVGGGAAYFAQYWMNAYAYPLNVGGRPPHMVPAFVPITFEMAILACALTAFLSVMALARLPSPWRPEFEVDGFERVSVDRIWMTVPLHKIALREQAEQVLRECGALQVREQT